MLRLRGWAAPLVAAGVAGAMAACGASEMGAFGPGNSDAGGEDAGSGLPDGAGGGDSGNFGDAVAADTGSADASSPEATGALFVHAAANLADLRLCWKFGANDFGSAPPFPVGAPSPGSNYSSVPVGGSVGLADASSLLGGDLTIVGIPATYLASVEKDPTKSPSCFERLSPTQKNGANSLLGSQTNLFTFTAPAGTVRAGATNVIAFAGCFGGSSGSTALCGASFTAGTGNLHLDVLPLHEIAGGGAGQIAFQAAQLSPALAMLAGDAGVVLSFGPQGATQPVATLAAEGDVSPTAAFVSVGADASAYGSLGFGVDVHGADGGPGHLWMSLEQALELDDPTLDPAVYYAKPSTYVVAIVGDPNQPHAFAPDAAFGPSGLHLLIVPLP